jgi:uncharacterized damage-inducible protein DinB
MDTAWLRDGFDHHAWAQERLLDAVLELTPEQLETTVPGTYGSVLDTVRHVVGSDAWYLFVISRERFPQIEEDSMSVAELRAALPSLAERWRELLAADLDPEQWLERAHEDGSVTRAPLGLRFAQVLHHGTDHRSQICTALTTLGIEPPLIDLWDYGIANGRTEEVPPPS